MGILRSTLIIGAVFAALPSPPPGVDPAPASQAAGPGTFAYLAAATETFADLRSFCERRPGVCTTAGYVADTMQAKAKYSFKLVYEWANSATQEQVQAGITPNLAAADGMATGSTSKASAPRRQSTLLEEDKLPPWKKPKPLQKG